MELEKKTLIRIGAGALIIVVALAVFIMKNGLSYENDMEVTSNTSAASGENESEKNKDEISREMEINDTQQIQETSEMIVDVGGAVKRPGIVCLKEGSRVYEAVEQAGGLLQDADTLYVNMAGFLTDGEKIYIPKIGEINEGIPDTESYAASGGGAFGLPSVAGYAGAASADGKVNLNTATSEQLQTLSGIGPSTAQKILDYRAQKGSFKKIEEIKNVSGIGDKTYEKFREKICI